MTNHADSTPVPASARPLSAWRIRGLIDYAKAATIAVDTDRQLDALLDVEASLWPQLAKAPILEAKDARCKLEAVLKDLIEYEVIENDDVRTRIIRQVIDFLEDPGDGIAEPARPVSADAALVALGRHYTSLREQHEQAAEAGLVAYDKAKEDPGYASYEKKADALYKAVHDLEGQILRSPCTTLEGIRVKALVAHSNRDPQDHMDLASKAAYAVVDFVLRGGEVLKTLSGQAPADLVDGRVTS